MKAQTKLRVAKLMVPLSISALAIGLAGTSAAFAAENTQSDTASGNVGPTTTGASTTTVPWCGWYITGLSSTIELTGDPKYLGAAVDLTGAADQTVSAFVNGSSSYSSSEDNCSWYVESNKQAAQLRVGVAEGSALAFTATTTKNDATDNTMNFSLTESNKLNITATPAADCSANSFTVESDASVFGTTTSSIPVKSSTSRTNLSTNNKCTWTMEYSTKIPQGLTPKYGDLTYTYTGPTLETTLEIVDSVAP